MSYTDLLTDTCLIERYDEGDAGAWGSPAITWENHLVNEACRLQDLSGKELKVGAELVVAEYKLFLGDINIIEQDRVTHNSIVYEILLVSDKRNRVGTHHKEVLLKVSR